MIYLNMLKIKQILTGLTFKSNDIYYKFNVDMFYKTIKQKKKEKKEYLLILIAQTNAPNID